MKASKTKLDIPSEVYKGAEALLKDRLVMPLPEFEERVVALLRAHIPAAELEALMEANGRRVGRSRGLNLTDWVKAWLTRQGKTKYLGVSTSSGCPARGTTPNHSCR